MHAYPAPHSCTREQHLSPAVGAFEYLLIVWAQAAVGVRGVLALIACLSHMSGFFLVVVAIPITLASKQVSDVLELVWHCRRAIAHVWWLSACFAIIPELLEPCLYVAVLVHGFDDCGGRVLVMVKLQM